MSAAISANRPMPQARPARRTVVARLWGGAWRTVAQWQERQRTRAALARLDDHLLADIGLDAGERRAEQLKPFWRA